MMEILFAFIGSVSLVILFNGDLKKFLWIGLSGAAGWAVYSWIYSLTGEVIISTFAGALAVGLYSESMARIMKTPAIIFSVSGIIPLVPGYGAYNTVKMLVDKKLEAAARTGLETVASAGAIALGVIFISSLFKVIYKIKARKS